jgi:hypothetical protein
MIISSGTSGSTHLKKVAWIGGGVHLHLYESELGSPMKNGARIPEYSAAPIELNGSYLN